jgi:hypothetical protein
MKVKMKKLLVLVLILAAATATAQATVITDKSIQIDNRVLYGIYIGTSTETKPTNVPASTLFYETDTGLLYSYTGTEWKPTGHPVIVGTSAETKPTDVMNGTFFIETDTGMLYSFDGSTWKPASGGITTDLVPAQDNVTSIGSPTHRYNKIYTYSMYTGDIRFANGWVLTEAENLGLGTGILLISPSGEIYGIGDLQHKTIKPSAIIYLITGLLGFAAGAVAVLLLQRR